MASPSFWFGSNAIAGTVTSAVAALGSITGTKQCLVVFWDDISTSVSGGGTSTPTTGEQWLGAVAFNAVEVTQNTLNTARNATGIKGAIGIDQGYYIPGVIYETYPVTLTFYLPSTLPSVPTFSGLGGS